jgi:hypothetical protein
MYILQSLHAKNFAFRQHHPPNKIIEILSDYHQNQVPHCEEEQLKTISAKV